MLTYECCMRPFVLRLYVCLSGSIRWLAACTDLPALVEDLPLLLSPLSHHIHTHLCKHGTQAAASSVVESLIDMQGCLVVVFTNSRC